MNIFFWGRVERSILFGYGSHEVAHPKEYNLFFLSTRAFTLKLYWSF